MYAGVIRGVLVLCFTVSLFSNVLSFNRQENLLDNVSLNPCVGLASHPGVGGGGWGKGEMLCPQLLNAT